MSRNGGGLNYGAHDLARPTSGVASGRNHDVTVQRTAIPIVFVPGIMGSRLGRVVGNRFERVWDPDDSGFMVSNYYSGRSRPAEKRQKLVGARFRAGSLIPYHPWHMERAGLSKGDAVRLSLQHVIDNTIMCVDAPFDRTLPIQRGWASVSASSYKKALYSLSHPNFVRELTRLRGAGAAVLTPVYAFGYEWTGSCKTAGEQLAQYAESLVSEQRGLGRTCPGVVLVTHSMGGLVARAACLLSGAIPTVLGVVHGVQPANGSPAAYWRMRAGFPRDSSGPFALLKSGVAARVLGTDGREVTALLSNMPGGLELLPNQRYEGAPGQRAWLQWPAAGGDALPAANPYTEIYLAGPDKPWRLVPDASWIDPGREELRALPAERDAASARGTGRSVASPFTGYEERIRAAERFHADLNGRQHPRTYTFYGRGVDTPCAVGFRSARVPVDFYDPTPPMMYTMPGAGFAPPPPRMPGQVDPGHPPTAAAYARDRTRAADADGAFSFYEPVPVHGRTDYTVRPDTLVVRHALRDPDGDGDGTVPFTSGAALCQGGLGCRAFPDMEHEPAYKDGDALEWTGRQVRRLIIARIGAPAPGAATR